MKNKNYIRRAPYFRSSIAYIMIFGSNCVKWYDQVVFFHFFKILIFRVVKGGGRLPLARKWQKVLSVSLRISGTGPHMIPVFGTHVKWWYLQHFFSFFQNSDFLGFSKVIIRCSKEILRCAPPSLHVCDFFS